MLSLRPRKVIYNGKESDQTQNENSPVPLYFLKSEPNAIHYFQGIIELKTEWILRIWWPSYLPRKVTSTNRSREQLVGKKKNRWNKILHGIRRSGWRRGKKKKGEGGTKRT